MASVKIKYPKSVKIGAKSYKVHWSADAWLNRPDEKKQDGDWGMTNHGQLGIWILPDLHPMNKRETLLHEIIHTLYASSGGDVRNIAVNHSVESLDIEEYTVCRLEAPMMAWMIDNPAVVAFIMIGADEDRDH